MGLQKQKPIRKQIVSGFFIIFAMGLMFALQPQSSGPVFNDLEFDQFIRTKSPQLQKQLQPILYPESLIQDRKLGKKNRDLSGLEALIYNLAPRIWWHPNEMQAHSDPLDFIAQSSLVERKSLPFIAGIPLKKTERIPVGKIDPMELAKNYSDKNYRPLEYGGQNEGLSGMELYYKGALELFKPIGQMSAAEFEKLRAPLFWRVSRHFNLNLLQEADPNSIVLLIEYWYHSVYNPIPITLGAHQGDWEGFGFLVKFSLEKQVIKHEVLQLYHSAHAQGAWVCIKDLEIENERYNLYSSLGTHATYPHSGTGRLGILADKLERGKAWETWKWLSPLQLEPYYGFAGAWGKSSFHWSMTGPMAPGPKFKYYPRSSPKNLDSCR